jgi:hypothetical protein
VLAAALFVAAAGAAVLRLARPPGDPALAFQCEGRHIAVLDPGSGSPRWDVTLPARVAFAVASPWPQAAMVIYGTMNDGRDGSRLCARDLASGDLLWTREIPAQDAARHFPADIASTGRFMPAGACRRGPADCSRLCAADFDGDGVTDIALRWIFEPWYPACITWYTLDPARPRHLVEKGRYYTCGSVSAVDLHDIDGDGRPGVMVSSTNNAPAFQGAMLTFLDAEHWSGGSVDSVSARTHWRDPPGLADDSRARVVLPQFEAGFMQALGFQRLAVAYASIAGDTIEVGIGASNGPVAVIRMDPCFEILDARVTAAAQRALAHAAPALRERFTDDYLRDWARLRVRFGECLR